MENSKFYRELFYSTLSTIEKLAQDQGVTLIINGKHLKDSEGILKLNPSIHITAGQLSTNIWSINVVRICTVPGFRSAHSEMMHQEAYAGLLSFIFRNNLKEKLLKDYQEICILQEDLTLQAIKERKTKFTFDIAENKKQA